VGPAGGGRGSGIPAALSECDENDVPAPTVLQDQGFLTVVLRPLPGPGAHRTGRRDHATRAYDSRPILAELEALPPSSVEAHRLVQELAEHGTADLELARAFESVAEVAKTHSDVQLVSRLSEMCLETLSSTTTLRSEAALTARVLVSGQAWHLLRENKLRQAAFAADDGTQIAMKFRDHHTVAHGRLVHARALLTTAVESPPQDRDFYLGNSGRLLTSATTLFQSINGPMSEEVGLCLALESERRLVRYRITRDSADLTAARERTRIALRVLTQGTEAHQRLTVLRAELCLADRAYTDGLKLATAMIDTSNLPDVVARSHQVRADLLLACRQKSEALQELFAAERQFSELGYEYSAATCWWTIAKIDSTKLVGFRLSPTDVRHLESLTRDPCELRLVLLEHELRPAKKPGRRSSPDWDQLLGRVTKA
jgi:hypothetical protein